MNSLFNGDRRAIACRALSIGLLGLLIVPSLSGCALFVQALKAAGPGVEPAKYKGLAGQSVAIVVWAEESGIRMDFPRLDVDAAEMIRNKMRQNQKEDKPKELELTRFPVSGASVARFQEENPAWASQGIEEIAPKFGVTRVIYVEIRDFQTRADATVDLYRGALSGSVSVVEVNNGKGHIAFTDDTLKITYPKTSPDEGLPNLGDGRIYAGTLAGFTTEVAKLFAPHGDDPDAEYATANRDPDAP